MKKKNQSYSAGRMPGRSDLKQTAFWATGMPPALNRMFKNPAFKLLIILLVISVRVNAGDGFKKYQNLLNTIDKAEGRAVLYLSSGYFSCTVNRKAYRINTDPRNADTKKAEVIFKYANGSITSLKIRFLPAIHIALVSNNCISLRVDSLTFDQDGDRVPGLCGYGWDNESCRSPNTDQLLDVLKPNLDYVNLFSGALCQNQPKFLATDNAGHTPAPQPFIYRVLLNDPQNAGLLATFKQGSEWVISEKLIEGASNQVRFNAGSFVRFKRIDYNLLEKSLDVRLDDARFNLQGGHFESGNIALNLENNTDWNIGHILLSQNGAEYELHYSGAALTGNVSAGSKMSLSGKTPSTLIFDNGSHIGLQGLDFVASNNSLDFSFEAGSIFNIHLLSGNLPVGDNGSVSLDRSSLDLDLSAHYSKGNSFSTLGSIISTDLNISGGKLYFNGIQDPLFIQNGKIRAKNLIVNSMLFPYLTGSFEFVQLTCDYNSELAVKNSISFRLKPGTVLTFGDRNFPFTLIANEKFPTGRFLANIKFDNFRNHKLGSLTVGNGSAKGNFRLISGEKCLIDSLSLSGSFGLNFNLQNTTVNGNGRFSLRGGTLQYIDGQPRFEGITSFNLLKGQDFYPVDIPGNYDSDSRRYLEKDRVTVYPVKLKIKLGADIAVPESQILFSQNLITLNPVSFPLNALIQVPGGSGEREWPDGRFNGDSGTGKQEVARFDCPDPLEVMHFYLDPADEAHAYSVSMKVSISSSDQKDIALNLSELTFDRPLSYEKVGCSDTFADLFAIVAGSIGSVVCGPCSLPVGVIAYIKAGDLVNGIIQGKIYSFMQDFNHTVTIKAR